MVSVTYVAPDGTRATVEAKEGDSLMATAQACGVDGIVGECGGAVTCATCHVYVAVAYIDKLSSRSEVEEQMLECAASERGENSRLSCQIRAESKIDGIVVYLPEKQT